MTRRDFIKTLVQLFSLIALPMAAQAKSPQPRLIQRCPLAGFQHHDGEELWPYLTVGDTLELRPEPGNPRDANAVRIDWLGRKLGYLPRNENRTTALMLAQGRTLEARIGALKSDANPWRRVEVEVWLIG